MMIIYIAGPYAPIDVSLHDAAQLAQRNVMDGIKAFWEVSAKGHIALVPFVMNHFIQIHQPRDSPTPPQSFWYEYDRTYLRASAGILMIGDWEKSKGAVDELKYSKSLGNTIFYNIEEIPEVTN